MDLYQYQEFYSQWGFLLYVFVMLVIAIGGSMAAFGESRFTRLVGLILVAGCAALLVVGAGIALELPGDGFAEEHSDAYRRYVNDPKATERVTFWGNLIVKTVAVIAALLTTVLFSILFYINLRKGRKKYSLLT